MPNINVADVNSDTERIKTASGSEKNILVAADPSNLRLIGFFHACKFLLGYKNIDFALISDSLNHVLPRFQNGVICIDSLNMPVLMDGRIAFDLLHPLNIRVAIFSAEAVEIILPNISITIGDGFNDVIVNTNSSDPHEIIKFITTKNDNGQTSDLNSIFLNDDPIPSSDALTPRQKQITWHIVNGHSVKEAAMLMGISPYTVRSHLATIFAKLGCRSKCDLIKYGIASGLLGEPPATLFQKQRSHFLPDTPPLPSLKLSDKAQG